MAQKMTYSISVAEDLRAKFPERVIEIASFRGQIAVIVKNEGIKEVLRYLRDEHSFDHLQDLCGVDYFPRKPRFEVVYQLYSISKRHQIRIRVQVDEDDPEIDSVTELWPGSNWHERECYDMFGIRFSGHPDLRRILMPEDWDGHPLRKDYPLQGRSIWSGFQKVLEDREG